MQLIVLCNSYIQIFSSFGDDFVPRAASERWENKASAIEQLEGQVMRMKEGWQQKEHKLSQERDKALDAAR